MNNCFVCAKPVVESKAHWLHIYYAGEVFTAEEAKALSERDSLGLHPVGPDCWRKHPELHPYEIKIDGTDQPDYIGMIDDSRKLDAATLAESAAALDEADQIISLESDEQAALVNRISDAPIKFSDPKGRYAAWAAERPTMALGQRWHVWSYSPLHNASGSGIIVKDEQEARVWVNQEAERLSKLFDPKFSPLSPRNLTDDPLYQVMLKIGSLARNLMYQRQIITEALHQMAQRTMRGEAWELSLQAGNIEKAQERSIALYNQIIELVEVLVITRFFDAEQAREVRGLINRSSGMGFGGTAQPLIKEFPILTEDQFKYEIARVAAIAAEVLLLFFSQDDIDYTVKAGKMQADYDQLRKGYLTEFLKEPHSQLRRDLEAFDLIFGAKADKHEMAAILAEISAYQMQQWRLMTSYDQEIIKHNAPFGTLYFYKLIKVAPHQITELRRQALSRAKA